MTMKTTFVGSLVLVAWGCATTTEFSESHLFQARDGQRGEIAYYRLSIACDAELSKSNYRADFYNARALDAFISSMDKGDTPSPQQLIERERRKAITALAAAYYGALDSDAEQPEIDKKKKRLEAALESPEELYAGSGLEGKPAQAEKYAVIYSSLASEIQEAIADFAESEETQKTILAVVAGLKRSDFITATVESEALGRTLVGLKEVKKDAKVRATAGVAGNQASFKSALTRLLDDVATIEVP